MSDIYSYIICLIEIASLVKNFIKIDTRVCVCVCQNIPLVTGFFFSCPDTEREKKKKKNIFKFSESEILLETGLPRGVKKCKNRKINILKFLNHYIFIRKVFIHNWIYRFLYCDNYCLSHKKRVRLLNFYFS